MKRITILVAEDSDEFIKFLQGALSKSDITKLSSMTKIHHFTEGEVNGFKAYTRKKLEQISGPTMGQQINARQFAKKLRTLLIEKLGPDEEAEAEPEE